MAPRQTWTRTPDRRGKPRNAHWDAPIPAPPKREHKNKDRDGVC